MVYHIRLIYVTTNLTSHLAPTSECLRMSDSGGAEKRSNSDRIRELFGARRNFVCMLVIFEIKIQRRGGVGKISLITVASRHAINW